MRVAQDERSPRHAKIDIPVTVHINYTAPGPLRHENRVNADSLTCPDRAVDASYEDLNSLGIKLAGPRM